MVRLINICCFSLSVYPTMTQTDSRSIFYSSRLRNSQFSGFTPKGLKPRSSLVSARLLIAGRITHLPFGGKSWFLPEPELGEIATLTCRFFLFAFFFIYHSCSLPLNLNFLDALFYFPFIQS